MGDVPVMSPTGELLGIWTTAGHGWVPRDCGGCGRPVRAGDRVYLSDGSAYCAPACERDAVRRGVRMNKKRPQVRVDFLRPLAQGLETR